MRTDWAMSGRHQPRPDGRDAGPQTQAQPEDKPGSLQLRQRGGWVFVDSQ